MARENVEVASQFPPHAELALPTGKRSQESFPTPLDETERQPWSIPYRMTVVVEEVLAGECITRDSSVVVVCVVEGSFSTTAVQAGNAASAASAKRLRRMLYFIDCAGFAPRDFSACMECCARAAAGARTQRMTPEQPETRTQATEPEAVDHLSTPEQSALELTGEIEHADGLVREQMTRDSGELTDPEKENGGR